MEKIKSYKDLQVWQRGVELSVKIYKLTENFPKSEQYGLTNQMRRASVSIPSNIAEGFGRSKTEFVRYIQIARGSLAELETQVEIAKRINYFDETTYNNLLSDTAILAKQLNVLSQRLSSRPSPPTTSN
jgi:four helix bundle protein